MKTIVRSSPAGIVNNLTKHVLTDTAAMFDIETTGFHKDRTSLYLIGAGRLVGRDFEITQFFADSRDDEQAVLQAFLDYLDENGIKSLISFNGLMFDVPYLSHKLEAHGIECDLSAYDHTDIYRIVSAQKALFCLRDYKQKSVEAFLGIHRDDEFNGGQLIPVYEAYTKSQNEELLALLLLHNYEDVLGMLDLLPALSYFYDLNGRSFAAPSDHAIKDDTLIFGFDLEYEVPRSLSVESKKLLLAFQKKRAELAIPVTAGEFKLFYPDYKNYYYLPGEDNAYHKSVAEFIDKSRRVKATRDTAYTRTKGRFVPSFGLKSDPLFYKASVKDDPMLNLDLILQALEEGGGPEAYVSPVIAEYLSLIREYIRLIRPRS